MVPDAPEPAPPPADLPPTDLPPTDRPPVERSATGLREPAHLVSPKAKRLWLVAAALGELIPFVPLVIWMVVDDAHRAWQWPVLAVMLVGSAAYLAVMPGMRYRIHRWEVTDLAVYTQSGWLTQERRIAPISRIQTVDSEYGPLERAFGLGTVTVTTASAAGALRIEGLERDVVERLVAELTTITAAAEGDAT